MGWASVDSVNDGVPEAAILAAWRAIWETHASAGLLTFLILKNYNAKIMKRAWENYCTSLWRKQIKSKNSSQFLNYKFHFTWEAVQDFDNLSLH